MADAVCGLHAGQLSRHPNSSIEELPDKHQVMSMCHHIIITISMPRSSGATYWEVAVYCLSLWRTNFGILNPGRELNWSI